MLTRLEVSGFKNLGEVKIDFGPFTCLAGRNGAGKSNIFDVLWFLSALADGVPLVEASQGIRGGSDRRLSDVSDIFTGGAPEDDSTIRICVEMIVAPEVTDDLGTVEVASATFLRYSLELGYARSEHPGAVGRPYIRAEELSHIPKGEAGRHLRFRHSASKFRDSVVVAKRFGKAFLSTVSATEPRGTLINIHGDGGSRGSPRPVAAFQSSRTILSTIGTNEHPTILAAKREMQGWMRLALEPSALRSTDEITAPRTMGPNGAHLAGTLYRIAHESYSDDPENVYARVASRLSGLAGIQVARLWVDLDERRDVFTLYVSERSGLTLPAKALSEGTLRFLALCVLSEDFESRGVIMMEEPENGIHPENLGSMFRLIQDLAVNPDLSPSGDNPLRQVIINTHSPGIVQLCEPQDLVLVDASGRSSTIQGGSRTKLRVLDGSWRDNGENLTFTGLDVSKYSGLQPDRHEYFMRLF